MGIKSYSRNSMLSGEVCGLWSQTGLNSSSTTMSIKIRFRCKGWKTQSSGGSNRFISLISLSCQKSRGGHLKMAELTRFCGVSGDPGSFYLVALLCTLCHVMAQAGTPPALALITTFHQQEGGKGKRLMRPGSRLCLDPVTHELVTWTRFVSTESGKCLNSRRPCAQLVMGIYDSGRRRN